MWWMLPVATSLMGMNRAKKQAEAQDSQNKAAAEANRYSPWTNKSYQYNNNYTPSEFEGAVGGGVQGLGIMQGLGKGFSGGGISAQQSTNLDALDAQSQQQLPWWQTGNSNGKPWMMG